MNPEETNPTPTHPDEPLAPNPGLMADPASPGEAQDSGGYTPPHGDPLSASALKPALPDEPQASGLITAHAAPEAPDDGGYTPPHGDPLGSAALEPALSFEEAPERPNFDMAAVPPGDSEPFQAFTADVPVFTTPEASELLVSAPVEPEPAGTPLANLEPAWETTEPVRAVASPQADVLGAAGDPITAVAAEAAETEVASAGPTSDEATVQDAFDQPEPLYGGPVEPAPAGLYLGEPADPEDAAATTTANNATDPGVHDDLEAAALATSAVEPEAEAGGEPEAEIDGGPNWMLAFICAWSSAISLREAWYTLAGGGWAVILRNLGVLGYLLLGVGLLAFAFDALRWGRPRRGVGTLVIPTLLTLAGVVCLVLWNERGRPI